MADASAVNDQPIILLAVGGEPTLPFRLPAPLPVGSVVVAADSGVDRLLLHGVEPHHVVGDLDSARPESVAAAEAGGAHVHRHPADKDATDLELALDLVAAEVAPGTGIERLVVVGAGGGRLDLLLGDVLALASPAWSDLEVTAHLGEATVAIVRAGRPRRLAGEVGAIVSILPLHGPASGVTTSGVRWPLLDADLVVGTTRALSNELLAPEVAVEVRDGVLAVVLPGGLAAPVAPRATPYDPTPRAPGGPT